MSKGSLTVKGKVVAEVRAPCLHNSTKSLVLFAALSESEIAAIELEINKSELAKFILQINNFNQ